MRYYLNLSSWIPLLASCLVIFLIPQWMTNNGASLLLLVIPGGLMMVGGGRMLLSPDLRAAQHVAVGSILGLILSLPLGFVSSATPAIAMALLSITAFIACGWYQITMQPVVPDVPLPEASFKYSLQVAIDNLFLGFFSLMAPLPAQAELESAIKETSTALDLIRERGWLTAPLTYHQTPAAPETTQSTKTTINGFSCDQLEFDSGYTPEAELPGSERWLDYKANRLCRATLLRQPNNAAQWIICVHGFGMGDPKRDLAMMQADNFFARGLNVALFTLPVHGARSPNKFSGSAFMGLSPLDYLHAETQAIWDLRRLASWIRSQGGKEIGVYGVSLGAYTSALFASIEPGLACVITGVPAVGVIANREFMASNIERRIPSVAGLHTEDELAIHNLVSPLFLKPLVPKERRYMFAGTGDQFVPVEQVKTLWNHWEKPAITWCQGGHVSTMKHHDAKAMINRAVSESFALSGK